MDNAKTANEYVGSRVREIRDALNLSQQELAHELGWQQTKLSRMERGITPITVEELSLMVQVMGRTCSYFFPRSDSEHITQREQQLLDLFRQLDGDLRRVAALQFIMELRDEDELFAEQVVLWKPEAVSSKYEQLKRWIGISDIQKSPGASFAEEEEVGAKEEIADEAEFPERLASSDSLLDDLLIRQSERSDEVKGIYWTPYLDQLEFRAFRELAIMIQHDLKYALENDKWDRFNCQGYQLAIEEIKNFHGRKK